MSTADKLKRLARSTKVATRAPLGEFYAHLDARGKPKHLADDEAVETEFFVSFHVFSAGMYINIGSTSVTFIYDSEGARWLDYKIPDAFWKMGDSDFERLLWEARSKIPDRKFRDESGVDMWEEIYG